ncbi:MAG: arylesterase [Desulfobulbaceae bacterium]|nr:arylesterase [Desulfobulbaceae bacterium]
MGRLSIILWIFILLGGLPLFAGAERSVLFLGDSLTAGLGVQAEETYPQLLGAMLSQDGITDVRIVNGSISGSTSASALARLQWYRGKLHPSVLFLALGANDGLRGLTIDEMEKNLAEVIAAAQAQGMTVILGGMELPPNYGDDFTDAFRKVYRDLAARYALELIPFLLEGVGGVAAFNQADGIHPNAEGHRRIALHVYPFLKQHLMEPHATRKK